MDPATPDQPRAWTVRRYVAGADTTRSSRRCATSMSRPPVPTARARLVIPCRRVKSIPRGRTVRIAVSGSAFSRS